jgi:hypothetical protein
VGFLDSAFKRTFKPFTAKWALLVALHVLRESRGQAQVSQDDAVDYIDNENRGLVPQSRWVGDDAETEEGVLCSLCE